MPGVTKQEIQTQRPIISVASDYSAVLVDADRGIPNEPVLVTSVPKYEAEFGTHIADKYSSYSVKGAFDNGLRNLWGIRVVSDDAKVAKGGDDEKVETSKALFSTGAGANDLVYVEADVTGIDGTNISVTVDTSVTNITTAALANDYDITLSLALTDAWRKTARVCTTVLNGQANYILEGAVPAADNSIIIYHDGGGTGGNNYTISVADAGGGNPATATYTSATHLAIEHDFAANVTASTINNLINAATYLGTSPIQSYCLDGAGAAFVNPAVLADTNLAGGQSGISAIVTASYGGTGLDATDTKAKTFLAGTGNIAVAGTFTDTSAVDPLTPVTDYVIPGDYLVIHNGANEGAYEILSVDSNAQVTVDGTFVNQTNCLWTIYGTEARYGHVNAVTASPGSRGNYMYVEIEKEFGDTTLKATVKVEDNDGVTRTLETYTGLSPIPTNANFIDTRFSEESRWISMDTAVGKTIATGIDGVSNALDTTFTSVLSDFVTDGVEAGDLLIIESGVASADVGVYVVAEITNATELEVTTPFPTGDTADVFTIVGDDDAGTEFMGVVGTSGITLTLDGGVDATPDKADYQGNESSKTGVYAINAIPTLLSPEKFWLPESPVVVDANGVDATIALDTSMGVFAGAKETLIYICSAEFGHTPSSIASALSSANIDNMFLAMYYPWGKIDDPITGNYKWVPLAGHMAGVWDAVGAGSEGIHKAPANERMSGVIELEYDVDDSEGTTLNNINLNVIRDMGYITAYGARLMTTDSLHKFIHKRRVIIRTVMSVIRALERDLSFKVNSVSQWANAKSKIDTYMTKYDRRRHSNGCFENKQDPTAQPWYVLCNSENNNLSSTTLNIEHGFCVVDMIEEIVYKYGLWDGGFTVEQQ